MNRSLIFLPSTLFTFLCISCSSTNFFTKQNSIPADVLEVKLGAYWKSEGKSGFVRASIHNGGYEKVMSQLFIEWITEPERAGGEHKVLKKVEVKELNNMWSMGNLTVSKVGVNSIIQVEATNIHDLSGKDNRVLRIQVDKIGSYKVLSTELDSIN